MGKDAEEERSRKGKEGEERIGMKEGEGSTIKKSKKRN